jgi:hypothetical protein
LINVLDEPQITTSTTPIAVRHKPVAHMKDTREKALDNHGYAAGLHRGLPDQQLQTSPEVPHTDMREWVCTGAGPDPPDFGPVTHYGT